MIRRCKEPLWCRVSPRGHDGDGMSNAGIVVADKRLEESRHVSEDPLVDDDEGDPTHFPGAARLPQPPRSRGQTFFVETVTVGNPGNAGEWSGESYGGYGPDRICGAVDYTYNIGKYEVTAGQYEAFLNAVAATDTYGLYNTNMWSHDYGCKIAQTGSPGSYEYSVAPGWADRPVNYVSWGDAARFANWLHNGQPTGAQDLTTTEDGSYYIYGATSRAALITVVRRPDATWVIPTESNSPSPATSPARSAGSREIIARITAKTPS